MRVKLIRFVKQITARLPLKQEVILGYHRVRPEQQGDADSAATLRAHVETLLSLGYRFSTIRELVASSRRQRRHDVVKVLIAIIKS
jgi:Holliday junction resolvasome RuvABC DNA-binding subunit